MTKRHRTATKRLPALVYKAKTAPPMKSMCSTYHSSTLRAFRLKTKCAALLGRKTLATLDAASGHNQTAGAAGHALQKAVHTCAVAFLWLVGSFWHMLSLYRIYTR